ncbi:MAG: hypothetical protein COW27_06185 [Nitrosopumilales archaeon CG15_BIG_FIL_POST_REV_8_21_14_020_37_12]|nr:MAG: hypothetical protein COW27_06185 [Nitrosopumilales archaeon CG15_BIG_FIL_POST_REV_8_21_14_020_37_12]
MERSPKNKITKVYCSKCDSIFESRKKFEKHLDLHTRGIVCEICPIDTMFFKITNFFKRSFSRNLE